MYAVTTTNEIFRFATFDWIKIPKVRASTIAVGKNGRIFITYANGKILRSIWDGESKFPLPVSNTSVVPEKK